jgi:hypothetical protein
MFEAKAVLKEGPGLEGREAKSTAERLSALYRAWGRPQKMAVPPMGNN